MYLKTITIKQEHHQIQASPGIFRRAAIKKGRHKDDLLSLFLSLSYLQASGGRPDATEREAPDILVVRIRYS